MHCQHCCGADKIFDLKGAVKEMKKYRKKGPGRITSKILEKLSEQDLKNKTLLDIGGGIGAICWFFLRNGGARILDVDASGAYLHEAEKFAIENGWSEKCRFIQGDLSTIKEKIAKHDFVTLDKVVCCYPDYKLLLGKATELCREELTLTFPVSNVISRLIIRLSGFYFYFRNNAFRTYIHSPVEIMKYIESKGFISVHQSVTYPWHLQVYRANGINHSG